MCIYIYIYIYLHICGQRLAVILGVRSALAAQFCQFGTCFVNLGTCFVNLGRCFVNLGTFFVNLGTFLLIWDSVLSIWASILSIWDDFCQFGPLFCQCCILGGSPAPGAEIRIFCCFRRSGHVKYSVLGLPGLEKTTFLRP